MVVCATPTQHLHNVGPEPVASTRSLATCSPTNAEKISATMPSNISCTSGVEIPPSDSLPRGRVFGIPQLTDRRREPVSRAGSWLPGHVLVSRP